MLISERGHSITVLCFLPEIGEDSHWAYQWNNALGTQFLVKLRRMPVPNSVRYPLERERDLERRWNRLLQQTLAPKDRNI